MNLSALSNSIARTSLADSVYETLLQAIVSGHLPSGTVLTSVELARQLEVSRTPVQEALHRLAADGLVECPTGRRATVARFARNEIVETYELRRVLEGETAARAAMRLSTEEVRDLQRRLESLLEASDTVDWCRTALEFDVVFHDRLAGACGNRRLEEDVQRYRLLVRSFCRMTGSVENLRAATTEHLAVVAALAERDADAARAAMHDHIDARLASVLREVDATVRAAH